MAWRLPLRREAKKDARTPVKPLNLKKQCYSVFPGSTQKLAVKTHHHITYASFSHLIRKLLYTREDQHVDTTASAISLSLGTGRTVAQQKIVIKLTNLFEIQRIVSLVQTFLQVRNLDAISVVDVRLVGHHTTSATVPGVLRVHVCGCILEFRTHNHSRPIPLSKRFEVVLHCLTAKLWRRPRRQHCNKSLLSGNRSRITLRVC